MWKQSLSFLLPDSLKKVLFVVLRLLLFLFESRLGGGALGLFIIFASLGRTLTFFYVASCLPFLVMILIMRPSLFQKNWLYISHFSLRLFFLCLLYVVLALFKIPVEGIVLGVFVALLCFDARGETEELGAFFVRLFRLVIFDIPLLACTAFIHWWLLWMVGAIFFDGGWLFMIGQLLSLIIFLVFVAFYVVVYIVRTTIDYERYFDFRK